MDTKKAEHKVHEHTKEVHASGEHMHEEHQEKHKMLQEFLWDKRFIILFILLVLLLGGLLAYKQFHPGKPQVRTITVNKQVLQKRSMDLGIIQRGLTGKAIDVNTGKIIKAARVFSPNDTTVYLELDFYSAPKGTVIDYIRYKNGRYVDHGEVTLIKANTKNILFNWIINNLLSNSHDGNWRVATYTNGVLSKRISYVVTKNQVSYVYPETPVRSTDTDYLLSAALTQH